MAIIIPFEEVARSAEIEEERIRAKEATYRGLLQEQARKEGRAFDELLSANEGMLQRVENDSEFRKIAEMEAREKRVSVYEALLDTRIEVKNLWISAFAGKKNCHGPSLEKLSRDL